MKQSYSSTLSAVLFAATLLATAACGIAQDSEPKTIPYTWKNVQYVGG